MIKDFSLKKKDELIKAFLANGFSFQTFAEYLIEPKDKVVILRHDVDDMPNNSMRFAEMQNQYGIKGSYYFRIVPQSFDIGIMKQIQSLGHEIGYHYETMDLADGNIDNAWDLFLKNLKEFRMHVDIKTICMHGSPRSKFDNRQLWNKHDYRELDIIGEPYLDIDFDNVFYLTDTGRRWDGHEVSVRDKVKSNFSQHYHSTDDIIRAIANSTIPNRIMLTFHPQRWHEKEYLWLKELVLQNIKNLVKRIFYVRK